MKVQQRVNCLSAPQPFSRLASHLPLPAGTKEHAKGAKFPGASSYSGPQPLLEVKQACAGTWVKAEKEKDVQYKMKIKQ